MTLGKCGLSIRVLAWFANHDHEAKSFIESQEKAFQFDVKGEEPFWIEWHAGDATLAEGRHPRPDVTFVGDSDTMFKVLIGEIDQDDAYNTKKIEIVGSIIDASRLRHFADLVQNSESPVTRADLFTLLKEMSGTFFG